MRLIIYQYTFLLYNYPMNINYVAVLVAAIAQFIFGAIWYMPIFGKIWGKIHGFDTLPKDVQEQMYKSMWPWLIVQFVITVVTSAVFALLYGSMSPEWNTYGFAGFVWLGFIVPTQAAAVIFGGTKPEWMATKIAIMASAALGNMMILALIMNLMN